MDEPKITVTRGMEKRALSRQLAARVDELQSANETIRALNADLQSRVEQATAELTRHLGELERANEEVARHVEQLQELDRLKSRFLSMASHELKTPLTAISGLAQLALRRLRRRLDEGWPQEAEWRSEQTRAVNQLEQLKGQTARLARLVDELLDVSRIESGRVEYRFEPLDIVRIVREAAERMQFTTAEHQISVQVDGTEPLIVEGDQDHLEQVLNNLLGNAIKYSPRGGPIDVWVGTAEDDEALVRVRDEGVGIPAEQLRNVFGLFYRAPEPTGARVTGMGLGLYISKEIVARHAGRIWVESTVGEGSTFSFSIPRSRSRTYSEGAPAS